MKYPSLQEYNNWLEMADKSTDGKGNNSKLYEFLWNMIVTNPRIRGYVNTRRTGVLSWGWNIVPKDGADPKRAEKAKIRLETILPKVISKLIDVPLFGLALLELKWQLIDENIGTMPVSVRSIPRTNLEALSDGTIIERKNNQIATHFPNSDTNYIVATDFDDIVGGQLRSIGDAEIIRNSNLLEWANYNKKLKGIIQAVEKGVSDEELSQLEKSMQELVKNNFVITSENVDYSYHSIVGASSTSFKELNDELKTSMAIAILGQANTSEINQNVGSRAALQVQALISADLMYSDIQIVEQYVNNQLLTADYKINYGAGVCDYKFVIDTNEVEDTEKNIFVIREAIASGIQLVEDEVYKKIGFTKPETTDKIIQNLV
jgi:phage gp29-like protein